MANEKKEKAALEDLWDVDKDNYQEIVMPGVEKSSIYIVLSGDYDSDNHYRNRLTVEYKQRNGVSECVKFALSKPANMTAKYTNGILYLYSSIIPSFSRVVEVEG